MKLRFKGKEVSVKRDDAEFFFKQLSMSESAEIQQKHRDNPIALGCAAFEKICTGWSGIYDEETGEPVKHSVKNMRALYDFAPDFVGEIVAEFNSMVARGDKKERKNS